MAQQTNITKETPPDLIERDIAVARGEMSKTVNELRERFSAGHFKAEVKEKIGDQIDYAKARGKELADRAKDSAARLRVTARETFQEAKNRLFRFIKENPSAARIIAFEAGALMVIAAQSLMKRERQVPGEIVERVLPEDKLTLEEVQEEVKEAALAPESEFKKAA